MCLYTYAENPYKNCHAFNLWPFESELGASELWAWVGGTIHR